MSSAELGKRIWAKAWEGRNWERAELAVCATVKSSRRARILKNCSTEKSQNSLTGHRSLIGDFDRFPSAPVFLCGHRAAAVSTSVPTA